MNYRQLARRAYDNAIRHGFWDDEPPLEKLMMLVITEVAEAVQADRKCNRADRNAWERYQTQGVRFEELFERFVKGTVEDEIADICIRSFSILGRYIEYMPFDENFECGKITSEDFCATAYKIVSELVRPLGLTLYDDRYTAAEILCKTIGRCEAWASSLGFDLDWHIAAKMRYNENRPYKHNCKY